MTSYTIMCDTLRNDADTGEECVACGAAYIDVRAPRLSHKWDAQPVVMTKPADPPKRLGASRTKRPYLPPPPDAFDARKAPYATRPCGNGKGPRGLR